MFTAKNRLHQEETGSFLPQYLNEKLLPPCPTRNSKPQKAKTLWKISRLGFIIVLTLHLICIQKTPSAKPIYYTRSPKQYDGSGGVTMITVELLQGGCLDWIGYAAVALFCGLVDPGVSRP